MKTFLTLSFILFGSYSVAHAKLLHIIHTNDLHSMFQGTRDGLGGYARLKTLVDSLRAESTAKNIPSLFLDAGDFGEGSSFYFSNQGVDSLRTLDLLGVDVSVLGNHDFILGGPELKRQMKKASLKAKIISANIAGKRFIGLHKVMPSHIDYNLEGLKLRIMGLTTSEIHFQYPFRPLGWIKSSHKVGIKMAEKAVREDVDFLIALTHIGLQNDIKLVENTRTVDLVIGGHSHTHIPQPKLVTNMEGREVPILQAGAHSLYVGSLLIDVLPDGKSTIVDYRMYDVTQATPEESGMKDFVEQAEVNREKYFNRKWDEVIGFSEIPLTGYVMGNQLSRRSCWSQHLARLTRKAAKTDIGLQFDDFQGEHINPGPVSFGDLVDNFPHFRKWGDKGWKIKKAWVQGFVLKQILKMVAKSDLAELVTIDGIEADVGLENEFINYEMLEHPVHSAMINGEYISNIKYYSVAMPSEVPHALVKMFNIFGYLIFNNLMTVRNTDYWPLLEDYIKKNSPIRCIDSQN